MRTAVLLGLPIVFASTTAWAQQQPPPPETVGPTTVTVTVGTPTVGAQAIGQPAQQPAQVQVQQPAQVQVQPAPQQYVVQQPGTVYAPQYVQPQYTTQQFAQPVIISPRPPAPPGTGLLIAGAVTFGVTYGTSLIAGSLMLGSSSSATTGGMLLIPVVGPFIAAGIEGGRTSYYGSSGAVPILILDGIAQTAGMILLIAGAVQRAGAPPPRQVTQGELIRPQWSVSPFASANGTGLMLSGTTF